MEPSGYKFTDNIQTPIKMKVIKHCNTYYIHTYIKVAHFLHVHTQGDLQGRASVYYSFNDLRKKSRCIVEFISVIIIVAELCE
jgi:hypothetical protein